VSVLIKNPVWPAISICPVAWLPAFASEKEMKDFHEANSPRCTVVRRWKCDYCGCWHEETIAPDPAGTTSGTTRSSKRLEA
jgi:hypothetical protein